MGYCPTPSHTELVSWHEAQLPATPEWIMPEFGAGSMKPVPVGVVFSARLEI